LGRITRLSSDFDKSLRRIKPEQRIKSLKHRPVAQLVSTGDLVGIEPNAILLDTNVYIHQAAGRLSPQVQNLLGRCLLFSSSVCLAELTAGVGHADPTRPDWKATKEYYRGVINSVIPGRLIVPDASVWAEAGLIAGVLARTQNYQKHQRLACLNDALIMLSAAKAGLPVLTENRKDFDLIQQLAPHSRLIVF
jgi:Predicted nucleic acid-binding protein, contains PIN domain